MTTKGGDARWGEVEVGDGGTTVRLQLWWRAEDEMKPSVAEWPAAPFGAMCIPARRF